MRSFLATQSKSSQPAQLSQLVLQKLTVHEITLQADASSRTASPSDVF
jgi:hypothetical protein